MLHYTSQAGTHRLELTSMDLTTMTTPDGGITLSQKSHKKLWGHLLTMHRVATEMNDLIEDDASRNELGSVYNARRYLTAMLGEIIEALRPENLSAFDKAVEEIQNGKD